MEQLITNHFIIMVISLILIVFILYRLCKYVLEVKQDVKTKAIKILKIIGGLCILIVLPISIIGSMLWLNFKIFYKSRKQQIETQARYISKIEADLQEQLEKNNLLEHRIKQLEQKINLKVRYYSNELSLEDLIIYSTQRIEIELWQKFKNNLDSEK